MIPMHYCLAAFRQPWRAAACLAAALLATMALPELAFAQLIPKTVVLHNSYTPPRNASVGTILQDKDEVAVDGAQAMTSTRTCTLTKTMTATGTLVPGMEKTYQTNVPGIGVHFYTTQGWGGGWELGPVNTRYTATPAQGSNGSPAQNWSSRARSAQAR
ncbi:hypothetical protein [Ottowia sp.]|uniref:hypothetical protein n=1 Tax=Ottowia sp. TaxID=1898956 RepID=UPI003C780EB5